MVTAQVFMLREPSRLSERITRPESHLFSSTGFLSHLMQNQINMRVDGIIVHGDDLRGAFECCCFRDVQHMYSDLKFCKVSPLDWMWYHFTIKKKQKKTFYINFTWLIISADFLFTPTIQKQKTCLLCVTAKCNKNRHFVAFQAEEH